MSSTGVLSVKVPINVHEKMDSFGLQEAREATVAPTDHEVKNEELGTALPRSFVPNGNAAAGHLRLAPQSAIAASDVRASAGPPTQVCRSQPADAPCSEPAGVTSPRRDELPQHAAVAPVVDPMDALMELSRAADMLSSLVNESAAASVDVVSNSPATTGAAEDEAPLPTPTAAAPTILAASNTAEETACPSVPLQPRENAPTAVSGATSGAVSGPSVTLQPRENAAAMVSGATSGAAAPVPKQSRTSPSERSLSVASQPQASQLHPSVSSAERQESARQVHTDGLRTAIGVIKLGDHLDVRWVEGDGQFYTATVTALTGAGVTILYPQSDEWDEWDEVLRIDDIVKNRVKHSAAPPQVKATPNATTGLKRKHRDGASDGAGCSWTKREDAQLRQLVHDEGVGNWEAKASKFVSTRTPNALRQRWCSHLSHMQLSDDEAASEPPVEGDRGSGGDHGSAGWTSREDRQLRQMVARQGTGNWETKADEFDTDRSAAALRFRWYKLAKEPGHVDDNGAERENVDASRWSAREDHQLQSMVSTYGPGNWRQKAEAFDTDRSADALRFRWYVIQKDGGERSPESDDIPARAPAVVTAGTNGSSMSKTRRHSKDERAIQPVQQLHTPSAWLPDEDAQLRALVSKEGPGNWQNKANRFKTGRSAGALRFRWYVLKDEDEAAAKVKHKSATSSAAVSKKRSRESESQQANGSRSSQIPRAANGQRTAVVVSEWSTAEDTQLHELVAISGAGNWKAKSMHFKKVPRSSSSLRARWAQLKDNGVAVDPLTGERLTIQVPEASINEEDQEWRSKLEVGFTCLCLYSACWYEVRVTQVKSDEDGVRSTRRNSESVKVHYVGWKNYYDEWVPRLSQRLWSQDSTPRWFKKYEFAEESADDESTPVRSTKSWTKDEDAQLSELCDSSSKNWVRIARRFDSKRTADCVRVRWSQLQADLQCAVESDVDDDAGTEDNSGAVSALDSHKNKPNAVPNCLAWTNKEDNLLKRLVESSGPSDWQSKAEQFHDRRSAGALRRRWCLLRDEMADEEAAADATTADDVGGSGDSDDDGIDDDDLSDDDTSRFQPPNGSIRERAAAKADKEWRTSLDIGSACACFSHNEIFAAKVIETRPHKSGGMGIGMLKVHYQGWSSKYDEWISRTSSRLHQAKAAGRALQPSGSKSKTNVTSSSASAPTAGPGGAWSALEDKQLRAMCAKDGPCNWDDKAAQFTAGERTASSLRQRWSKLQFEVSQKSSSHGASTHTSDGVNRWSEEEDKQLRKMAVKTRQNWSVISSRFTTDRSASALRRRWYTLQELEEDEDADGGTSSDEGVDTQESGSSSSWLPAEDAELRKLVADSGSGDWETKAAKFSTSRSSGALRFRWHHLRDADTTTSPLPVAPASPGVSTGWTSAEDNQLRKLVEHYGEGDWQEKAAAFKKTRSSSSIRHRWYSFLATETEASSPASGSQSPRLRSRRSRQSADAESSSSGPEAEPTRKLRKRGFGDRAAVASSSDSTGVTDEELARELQRELNGVRKREAVRYPAN